MPNSHQNEDLCKLPVRLQASWMLALCSAEIKNLWMLIDTVMNTISANYFFIQHNKFRPQNENAHFRSGHFLHQPAAGLPLILRHALNGRR
ncbi:hypothetical protein DFR42_104160 [Undibacterium pigrum]|uniref:Uncharacterized protein n=1 Tax=Undibacterium pigrum TaxID=401470 RepID=A0A318J5N5_9BURK|nr:hypothetical protein DFR42_104160 [Undibacterium pigrum]